MRWLPFIGKQHDIFQNPERVEETKDLHLEKGVRVRCPSARAGVSKRKEVPKRRAPLCKSGDTFGCLARARGSVP